MLGTSVAKNPLSSISVKILQIAQNCLHPCLSLRQVFRGIDLGTQVTITVTTSIRGDW
jgi:hypothetical protein